MAVINATGALIIVLGLLGFGFLLYRRADVRRSALADLRQTNATLDQRVKELEADNTKYRNLVLAIYHDTLRHEKDEPLLAGQIAGRITTHPYFRDLIEKELEP